jgi:uncharacterized ion transporter superfamily protein YfcC
VQPSRLPHPLILLLAAVALAAVLTWILPAGSFDRRDDPATGRRVVVAGTYHPVERAPVGPFAAAVSVPRGFVAGADVIGVVLFVGGAWVVVDRLGTLPALVAVLVARFRRRGLWAIPVICTFFAIMGALENMQEEIIPLVPVLLVLGAGLGVDAVAVVAMSVGAAIVGSAFGPTNPFQAGIALKLAQLPPFAGGGLRVAMFVAGLAVWIAWTVRYAARNRVQVTLSPSPSPSLSPTPTPTPTLPLKHVLILILALAPMAMYVYGALRLDWGFNELSGAFLVAGILAGLVGGLGTTGTLTAYLEGRAESAARRVDDRRGAQHLDGSRRWACRGHDPERPRHGSRERAGDTQRISADCRAGARARRGAERQRSGGVDDAAVRAAGGPAGDVAVRCRCSRTRRGPG